MGTLRGYVLRCRNSIFLISEPVIDLLITYCNLFNFLVGLFSTYGDLFGPSLNKCK